MVRKFVAAFAALVILGGSIFAEEIRATFVKYSDGKVTVKVKDEEKSYTVDEKATMKVANKEFPLRTWFQESKALAPGKSKLVLVVDSDVVTGVKPDTGGDTEKKKKKK